MGFEPTMKISLTRLTVWTFRPTKATHPYFCVHRRIRTFNCLASHASVYTVPPYRHSLLFLYPDWNSNPDIMILSHARLPVTPSGLFVHLPEFESGHLGFKSNTTTSYVIGAYLYERWDSNPHDIFQSLASKARVS